MAASGLHYFTPEVFHPDTNIPSGLFRRCKQFFTFGECHFWILVTQPLNRHITGFDYCRSYFISFPHIASHPDNKITGWAITPVKYAKKVSVSAMAHAMILYGHRWHLRIQQRYQSNMSLSLFFRVLDTLLLPHCQRQWRLLLSVFSSIQSDINYPEQNEISWIYLFSPGAGDMMMYRLRCGVNVKWYVNYSFLNANWMQTYSELNSPDTTW